MHIELSTGESFVFERPDNANFFTPLENELQGTIVEFQNLYTNLINFPELSLSWWDYGKILV